MLTSARTTTRFSDSDQRCRPAELQTPCCCALPSPHMPLLQISDPGSWITRCTSATSHRTGPLGTRQTKSEQQRSTVLPSFGVQVPLVIPSRATPPPMYALSHPGQQSFVTLPIDGQRTATACLLPLYRSQITLTASCQGTLPGCRALGSYGSRNHLQREAR